MPTTAATIGHMKGPISALLATSLKGLRSLTRTTTSTSHHEKLGSTSNLRPAYSDSTPQRDGREEYELQRPWSGPQLAWSNCEAEPESVAVYPPEDTRIRKSTKVEVA